MILILSREQAELSTEEVIDWLEHYKAKFIRINGEELTNFNTLDFLVSNSTIDSKSNSQLPNDVKVVWYRRWHFFENLDEILFRNDLVIDNQIVFTTHQHIKREILKLSENFFEYFGNSFWFDKPDSIKINKLNLLKIAVKLNLNIPDTLVTKSLQSLKKFYRSHNGKIITKPISDVASLSSGSSYYSMATQRVTDEHLKNSPKFFYPSLFQKEISKVFEIRTFYLCGSFYSMAIFSQKDKQTEVDFRNYNNIVPNRNIPYLLPNEVEVKLKKMMDILNLNHASIDLIKNEKGDFIFLEVNPVGQFGMVSNPCNYFLEQKLAEKLIQYDK